MPFVIAVEPDRHQAAQLSQIVLKRVGAELLLAATLDEALDALRIRAPDLMLIPALMSAKEDAALTEALRAVSGPSAVPILITPTFAATRHSFVSGAVWPWSRRETPATEDGCDPAAFAEQLTTYLAQSAARPISQECDEPAEVAFAGSASEPAPPVDTRFALIDERIAAMARDATESPAAQDTTEFPAHEYERETIADRAASPSSVAAGDTRVVRADDVEWERLIASFRAAVEGLQIETWLGRPADSDEPARPIHDGWGIYDPEQCAMPAVMRRLEELQASGNVTRRK